MKTLKINKYFLVLIAALCMSLGFLTLTSVPTVKAEAPTGFVMNGASVRFKQDEETTETSTAGIRFESIIPQTEYAALGEVTEVGFLVVPRTKYNGEEIKLTTENEDIQKIVAVGGENDSKFSVKYNDVDYYAFRAYIYKIPQKSYYANLRVVSYITVGEDTYYTEVCTRSIAEVATKAYADTQATYTTEQRVDLKSYIDLSVIQLFNNDLFATSLRVSSAYGSATLVDSVTMNEQQKVGVAKLHFPNANNDKYFSVDLPIPVTEYTDAGYDLIGITLAHENIAGNIRFDFPSETGIKSVNIKDAAKAELKWVTYFIPLTSNGYATDLKTCINDTVYRLCEGSVNVDVYISEIRAYKLNELVSLSSNNTAETITITPQTGYSGLRVLETLGYGNEKTLVDNAFFAAQSIYNVIFNKGSEIYDLLLTLTPKNPSEISMVNIAESTDNLRINTEITLTVKGLSVQGSDVGLATEYKVYLYDTEDQKVSDAVKIPWTNDTPVVKFTPTVAGTYYIKASPSYGAFARDIILNFYVKDKQLTVSGDATVNDRTLTLPKPVLTSLIDSTISDYTLTSASVVIGRTTYEVENLANLDNLTVNINELGNFVATYNVTDLDGIKYSCTLTGQATDGNILSIEDAQTKLGISGETITLPEPVLKDNGGNELTYSNLSVILTKGGENIVVNDFAFAGVKGDYKAVYNVDYNGMTYACNYEFSVISPVVSDFSSSADISILGAYGPKTKEYSESETFDGVTKNGVGKIKINYWQSRFFQFDFPRPVTDYIDAGYDYIGITLANQGPLVCIGYPYGNGNTEAAIQLNTEINADGKWITYLIPISYIVGAYKADGTVLYKDQKNSSFKVETLSGYTDRYLYIDEIRAYNKEDLVTLSSNAKSEPITITSSTGISNEKVYGQDKAEVTLNESTFTASKVYYLISFTKESSNYVMVEKFS